ncbi:MAG: DNA gyrase subunit A, partial [Candidatus Levybacteria bacterium]|nr:DNA gyrase subunit A [Candidatus Levybacteria bacterium]
MNIGKLQKTEISTEMKKAYLDYAMSVIVSRALPDVRDGLKPVHRRILFAMHEMNLTHQAKYSKSAKIVGEVMGKYHPHGDLPIYDALVRLAQSFSMRYPLVDGQGNYGSVDGDPAAAMRYTEARMAAITSEMLIDIDKETVEYSSNFDATLKEPVFLPAKLPNLLLMGSEGIAVGMATKIPPHNLGEIVDAIIFMISKTKSKDGVLTSDVTVDDLLQFVKGPDFPTAASIYDASEIRNVYETGRGKIVIRGKAEIEDIGQGKSAIIITELPYQVNKALLVARIADLAKDKKIEGISDLRDESDRHGTRIMVELKRDAVPKKVLNNLFKHTTLQTTFPANIV